MLFIHGRLVEYQTEYISCEEETRLYHSHTHTSVLVFKT